MTTRDVRRVGEMLVDVDHLARQLLMAVNGDGAAAVLRSWPMMVAAAEDLWFALPRWRSDTEVQDRPMNSLAAQAVAIETSLARQGAWPGHGPTSAHLDQMTQALRNAAVLVRRFASEVPRKQPDTQRDVEAARITIMHGLYLTAHAVNVALHDNGRGRVTDAHESGRRVHLAQNRSPYAVAPISAWVDRIATCEHTARSYLSGGCVKALAGEMNRPVEGPGRLARALANWDIQSHRALAGKVEPPNIVLITRTQSLIAGASMVLIDAAAAAGMLEPSDRLAPTIAAAGRSWSHLAGRWADLTSSTARLEEPLAYAAAEIRAAYRQLTHDATTVATPEVIATSAGIAPATMATLRAIEAGSELAHVAAEKADNPNLTGPARALSRRAHNDVESGYVVPPPEGDVVWTSPADILARRLVPLPKPVEAALRAASDAAVLAAGAASRAASLHLPPERVRAIPRDRGPGSEQRGPADWQPLSPAARRGVEL